MSKRLNICFTSDVHGYLFPTDYVSPDGRDMGLMKLSAAFPRDEDTLLLDCGDSIQGSPLANFYHRQSAEEKRSLMPDSSRGTDPFAVAMNCAGYQYVTLGNHDFNMGIEGLRSFLNDLDARCLCCNIRDRAHELPILPWAIHVMPSGLRVGIVGACTDFVRYWEDPATVALLEIEEPVAACRKALEELRGRADVTVLLYHGGLERDLDTGRLLTESTENQGCRICAELDFDLVLTGHQHAPVPLRKFGNSYVCQPPFRGTSFCHIEGELRDDGSFVARGENLPARGVTPEEPARLLSTLQAAVQRWLDTPVGHLDMPLDVTEHIPMAIHGCPLCNFMNTVLRELTGAQVTTIALANDSRGLPRDVTIRNVVSAYIYSNTLLVLDMTVRDLRLYMERCADYFQLRPDGSVTVSQAFMLPKVAHYNYDYFSGIDYTFDISRPSGSRLTALSLNGRGLNDPEERISVAVTSYRFNGTGGFDMLPGQPVLKDVQVDVADAIIDYLLKHPTVTVDTRQWCHVVW